MTENQRKMIKALNKCIFLPGSFDKRFARDMYSIMTNDNADKPLTEKQGGYLAKLFHKYRKQIGHIDHDMYCEVCK